MTQTDEFGEDLADFVRRVGELRTARTAPMDDLHTVLDAALFELDHAAQQLWPRFEQLVAGGGAGSAGGGDRAEQQLLRAVFQRLPLPVALVDRETVVRRMNFAAASFTGVRAGYATGRPLAGLLAPGDRAAFRSQAAAVARGEGDRSLTVHLQQRPADPVRATLTPLRPSNEPRTAVLVVLQPAESRSGRPQMVHRPVPDLAEATLHAALMDLVDAMASRLLGLRPGDRAAVLNCAAEVLHGRFADWVIADAGASRMSRTAVLGPADDPEGAVAAVAGQDPAACPLVVEAARGGSTALQVRPEDPDGFGVDAAGTSVLVRADVTSLLCVPLVAPEGGRVEGVLTLFRTGARLAFSMAEAQAVDVMSRHVALAMRRPG
ncbi:PAS domain-containing protein [Streptomyces sp. NBC_01304]|uniref:PAS domain-containing protein n=1 Tax=Streptomyces sp. NBC_01304 TaxID=2903818 RepID=UPI002E13ACBB|nr:PAS domain-containing protein [Streptomyces sp. NBC_01304]